MVYTSKDYTTEVRKMDNKEYEIKGVSRTRLTLICLFKRKYLYR